MSLHACTTVSIHIAPGQQNFVDTTPDWAVDVVANAVASYPNVVDLEINYADQTITKPLIKDGSCPNLRRFSIKFQCIGCPEYFFSHWNDTAASASVIYNTIDIAIAGKLKLETLEVWGLLTLDIPKKEGYTPSIFGGWRLKNSSPLKIKTLKLDNSWWYEHPVTEVLPHVRYLDALYLSHSPMRLQNHIVAGSGFENEFWHMLSKHDIRLRSLSIPDYPINMTTAGYGNRELYLVSYTGLEELVISGWSDNEGMSQVLHSHNSTLRRLKVCGFLPKSFSLLRIAQKLECVIFTFQMFFATSYSSLMEAVSTMPSMRTLQLDEGVWGMPNTSLPMIVELHASGLIE